MNNPVNFVDPTGNVVSILNPFNLSSVDTSRFASSVNNASNVNALLNQVLNNVVSTAGNTTSSNTAGTILTTTLNQVSKGTSKAAASLLNSDIADLEKGPLTPYKALKLIN